MKKVNLLLLVALALGLGIYLWGTRYGFQLGGVSLSWNQDKNTVERQTQALLEDIVFKDFRKAANHHHPSEQSQANIPKLIEEKFKIKPEQMDITEYKVLRVDIDRSGSRARALTTANVKLLNTQEIKDVEAVYFWHKWDDGKWYLQLRSSLE